jgi:hypothetical protein
MKNIIKKIISGEFWEDMLIAILRPGVIVFQKLRKKSRKRMALMAGIIILVMITVFGWQKFYALAQSFIDSFIDSSRIASTWNVTVDTGNGQVTLAARTCDDDIWFCSANTTCTDSLGDGSYIIVKRTNEAGSLAWKSTNTGCDMPQCGQDGGQDGDNLVADNTVNFSSYPARDACRIVGGRLPTKTELQCIYANKTTFGNNFGSSFYWSSTEYSATYASFVSFDNGNTASYNKSNYNSVRCVQGW